MGQLANTAPQPSQVLPQGRPRPEHRFCRSFKHGIAHRQSPDAQFEPVTRYGADLDPEVPRQPAQGQFQGNHALLNSLVSAENSPNLLG